MALLQHDEAHRCDDDRIHQVIAALRDGGDDVLSHLAMDWNGIDLDPSELQIADGDFVHAFERLAPERTRGLDETVNRIRDFHEAEMPQELWLKQIRPSQWAGHRYRPIDAAACFVPSGSDVLSEAAVMNAIPALVAEVPRVVIVTPPESDGSVSDLILVAAATVGVGEIYKLDAMSAAPALSLGTERIPKVDRLMTPHNRVLAEAKRVLANDLEIVTTGGKATAILLADAWAHADAVKSDLMAVSELIGEGAVLLI
ncbi:MAG: histidinol dehydrogenase, partial [Geminicoccaceae bacterium]